MVFRLSYLQASFPISPFRIKITGSCKCHGISCYYFFQSAPLQNEETFLLFPRSFYNIFLKEVQHFFYIIKSTLIFTSKVLSAAGCLKQPLPACELYDSSLIALYVISQFVNLFHICLYSRYLSLRIWISSSVTFNCCLIYSIMEPLCFSA